MNTCEPKKEVVWTACRNASGEPTLQKSIVDVTDEQFTLGEHYDLAEDALYKKHYVGPYLHFDRTEIGDIRRAGLEVVLGTHDNANPEQIALQIGAGGDAMNKLAAALDVLSRQSPGGCLRCRSNN